MRQAARQRAKTILQTELPAYIAHLDDLLEQQSQNPESPLWHGHLESGSFIKKNVKLLLLKGIAKDGMIPSETPHNFDDIQLGGTQATKGQEDKSTSKKSEDDFGGEDNEDTFSDACWKGRLPPNEICDRLADLVHKYAYHSRQAVILTQIHFPQQGIKPRSGPCARSFAMASPRSTDDRRWSVLLVLP